MHYSKVLCSTLLKIGRRKLMTELRTELRSVTLSSRETPSTGRNTTPIATSNWTNNTSLWHYLSSEHPLPLSNFRRLCKSKELNLTRVKIERQSRLQCSRIHQSLRKRHNKTNKGEKTTSRHQTNEWPSWLMTQMKKEKKMSTGSHCRKLSTWFVFSTLRRRIRFRRVSMHLPS